jgi:hypothetical protein
VEFVPGITFINNTVYYWRVAPVLTGSTPWNASSFVYLQNSEVGFNQSHVYQHLKSSMDKMYIDSASRKWNYTHHFNNIFVRNGVYPTTSGQGAFYTGTINDVEGYLGAGCNYDEFIVNVIDPITFKPWKNTPTGLFQSNPATCGSGREYNFLYLLNTVQSRKKIMDFIDSIPEGYIVMIRGNVNPNQTSNTYSSVWKSDEAIYGSGNSLYHKLFNQGLTAIDSFNRPRSWIFIFKKDGQASFTPVQRMSDGIYDGITADVNIESPYYKGTVSSPVFGPAKEWKRLQWEGSIIDIKNGDSVALDVIGISASGSEQILFNKLSITSQDIDLSSIDALNYPYIKLKMYNQDSVNLTPYQLDFWRIFYTPVPEGALAANQYFAIRDTVEVAEPLPFGIAFKNISKTQFPDSIKIKVRVTDKNNLTRPLPEWNVKPLISGDTVHVNSAIDTRLLSGNNTLYVEVNPDNDQPEQYHFNNFFYKSFYVRPDSLNPLLDVTFDNVHILNHDIVSAKPYILIKLQDEAKWYLLSDSSTISVNVKYPDGSIRPYSFGSDTLQFIPAMQGANNSNVASAVFKPYFLQDGEYELIVSGKDMSQNKAGNFEYRVVFNVYNKPMISNMLNYPNPFTTSTAFVFTITGSQVPQNIRIQILTITGKVVREITKDELGPLHIGRNITEFKWDGTDQYGQKLANGVYLYRVITNLNGKALDKFNGENDGTDKYFNKGYGKMYLMR